MSESPQSIRLDLIQTRWSLLRQAQAGGPADDARRTMVLRYGPAIRRYVGAILPHSADADEVAQDLVVRILKGDFARADPGRGRFRDLLKTAIRNMIRNYSSREGLRRGVDYDMNQVVGSRPDEAGHWEAAWSGNLLDLAWAELEDYERTHSGSIAHRVLRLRTDFPDDSSEQLAERLSAALGRPIKAEAARQQLRRARLRFAEILVKEVADGLESADPERVTDELIALGLYETVREFLPPEWSTLPGVPGKSPE